MTADRPADPARIRPLDDPLRAERVGGPLRAERVGDPLKTEEVEAELPNLPGWTLAADGTALLRTVELPSFRAALAYVAFVGEIALACGHAPDVDLRGNLVSLRLTTHEADGLTGNDLELARLLSGVY